MTKRTVELIMEWISNTANPANREDTDMKKALCHFSSVLMWPMVSGLLPSRRKYTTTPRGMRTASMVKMNLLLKDSLHHL